MVEQVLVILLSNKIITPVIEMLILVTEMKLMAALKVDGAY